MVAKIAGNIRYYIITNPDSSLGSASATSDERVYKFIYLRIRTLVFFKKCTANMIYDGSADVQDTAELVDHIRHLKDTSSTTTQ